MSDYIEGQEPVTLIRYGKGSRDLNGEWAQGPSYEETIYMSIQPLGGNELATLPEGERSSYNIKGYTRCLVRVADQNVGYESDKIRIDCDLYEVRQVQEQRSTEPHYKIRMVRVWPR